MKRFLYFCQKINSIEKQKILLVGGSGFIGSFICRDLLKKGYEPIVYDAFINYISPLKSAYQQYLSYRFKGIEEKVTILRGDACNKAQIRRAILDHKPERIIHLAALPIADLSNEAPKKH